MATTFEKNVLGLFRFPLLRISSKIKMHDPPFLLPPLLNKNMRKDLTPEDGQLVLDNGLRNLKRGPDGDYEIDGQLVLVRGTVKYLVSRFKTTIQCIWNCALVESNYNGDVDVFASPSRKFLAGHPLKHTNHNYCSTVNIISHLECVMRILLERYPTLHL